MAEKSRKGPPPTKSERKRMDAKRETKTTYTDASGARVTVETHGECGGKGCGECDDRGFTRV